MITCVKMTVIPIVEVFGLTEITQTFCFVKKLLPEVFHIKGVFKKSVKFAGNHLFGVSFE